jgi:hypothetical protein
MPSEFVSRKRLKKVFASHQIGGVFNHLKPCWQLSENSENSNDIYTVSEVQHIMRHETSKVLEGSTQAEKDNAFILLGCAFKDLESGALLEAKGWWEETNNALTLTPLYIQTNVEVMTDI